MSETHGISDRRTALVFCGGMGTRLQPLTFLIRKEMLPIGKRQRPLLEHVVLHLRRHGIRQMVFLGSNPQGDNVSNYFGDGSRFGVTIIHQPDPDGCRGTGHALLAAVDALGLHEHQLLLYYGDMLTNVDLADVIRRHDQAEAAATLVLSNAYTLPKGVVKIGVDGTVELVEEKPSWEGEGKIAVGILCLDAARLRPSSSPKVVGSNQDQRDLMRDIIPALVTRKEKVISYVTKDGWLDIGSFEDYARVREKIDWIVEDYEQAASQPRLRVFLSYHLGTRSKQVIEEIIAPSLEAAGIEPVLGCQLSAGPPAQGTPSAQANWLINESDCFVAIVLKEKDHKKPSDHIMDEVAHAAAYGKLTGLFIEGGMSLPDPWRGQYTYREFSGDKTGELVRDVLKALLRGGTKPKQANPAASGLSTPNARYSSRGPQP